MNIDYPIQVINRHKLMSGIIVAQKIKSVNCKAPMAFYF